MLKAVRIYHMSAWILFGPREAPNHSFSDYRIFNILPCICSHLSLSPSMVSVIDMFCSFQPLHTMICCKEPKIPHYHEFNLLVAEAYQKSFRATGVNRESQQNFDYPVGVRTSFCVAVLGKGKISAYWSLATPPSIVVL